MADFFEIARGGDRKKSISKRDYSIRLMNLTNTMWVNIAIILALTMALAYIVKKCSEFMGCFAFAREAGAK